MQKGATYTGKGATYVGKGAKYRKRGVFGIDLKRRVLGIYKEISARCSNSRYLTFLAAYVGQGAVYRKGRSLSVEGEGC